MDVGKAITKATEKKGISRAKLARMADISDGYLAAISHGRRNPSLAVLEKIASALGLTLVQFLRMGE